MLKLSKFKIILGITTFTTVATLPFLILSINEKTVENHKNISDITFSKALKSESLEVISALKQKNAESFSSTNENTEERIKDFSKFEKDFQDYIDEVSQNPNLNLEKIAKEKLLRGGVTADNIEKIFASKNSKNNKIQNQDLLVKPQSFSSKSATNLKMKEFADKLLQEHIKTAVLAAVNYGLAVAYALAWIWPSVIPSTIAGGILTWLSVEYKNAYNSLVYDKNWDAIKEIYWPDLLSRVSSYVGLGLTGREIWKQMGRLSEVQVAATAALKPVRWVNPKIAIVLATIDLFQTIISLHNS
ncbi:hypothetical protein [Mesomycoplasma ovipneumoniae]|uniref:hypothetical protein n=1 Tax=Mesomycoplasma ovipneumoniae TaxID=29562 RepID=UPI00096A6276|nr:hypothetical protein [Mesomycoplasma ovipneumoniae]WDV48403.1 hypothetical protein PWA39_02615 [Mesomycoplasma ovipneumoniae ATCC 29419]